MPGTYLDFGCIRVEVNSSKRSRACKQSWRQVTKESEKCVFKASSPPVVEKNIEGQCGAERKHTNIGHVIPDHSLTHRIITV